MDDGRARRATLRLVLAYGALSGVLIALDKPLYNIAMTFMEPTPIGLLVTVVSAAALTRRQA